MRSRHSVSKARTPSPSPLTSFVTSIVGWPSRSAQVRLPIPQYREFHNVLATRLQGGSSTAPDIGRMFSGKLVGICPACEVRLSGEYLEWIYAAAASGTLAGPKAAEVARFAQGRCVNEYCSSHELVLLWQP